MTNKPNPLSKTTTIATTVAMFALVLLASCSATEDPLKFLKIGTIYEAYDPNSARVPSALGSDYQFMVIELSGGAWVKIHRVFPRDKPEDIKKRPAIWLNLNYFQSVKEADIPATSK